MGECKPDGDQWLVDFDVCMDALAASMGKPLPKPKRNAVCARTPLAPAGAMFVRHDRSGSAAEDRARDRTAGPGAHGAVRDRTVDLEATRRERDLYKSNLEGGL